MSFRVKQTAGEGVDCQQIGRDKCQLTATPGLMRIHGFPLYFKLLSLGCRFTFHPHPLGVYWPLPVMEQTSSATLIIQAHLHSSHRFWAHSTLTSKYKLVRKSRREMVPIT